MQLSFEQTAHDAENHSQAPIAQEDGIDQPIPRLISELRAVLRESHSTAEEQVQQARALLSKASGIHHVGNDSNRRIAEIRRERGGLAPWQVRCLKKYIEQRIEGRLTGAELAERVGLSEHHFCRAFRVSVGQAPHAYVVRRRVERASDLMLFSKWTIGQIASECGFADQAHLNRCFRSLKGTSPGVWRREQVEAMNTRS